MPKLSVEPGQDAVLTGEIRSASAIERSRIIGSRVEDNAFEKLIAPKPAKEIDELSETRHRKLFKNRDSLGAYIAHPQTYPRSQVPYYNDKFVIINDMYPKASAHALLLPRSQTHTYQHPFDAFEDPYFLAEVRAEVDKLKGHIASELRRKFGKDSAKDAAREAVLNGEREASVGEDGKDTLPAGRDWSREVKTGIHAGPSMNHLHVHVISRDMFSDRVKHRKHYNSFNTPFLVDLSEFPLPANDPRRHNRAAYLSQDLVCWRCGKNFGNRFSKLKEHLAEEFEQWNKE